MQPCPICGNEIARGTLRCPHCESNVPHNSGTTPGEHEIFTINLEEGMPPADEAVRKMDGGLRDARDLGFRVVLLIHGYGSSGQGGKIRDVCRRQLLSLVRQGTVSTFLPGERFCDTTDDGRAFMSRRPEVRRLPHSQWWNPGITLVDLGKAKNPSAKTPTAGSRSAPRGNASQPARLRSFSALGNYLASGGRTGVAKASSAADDPSGMDPAAPIRHVAAQPLASVPALPVPTYAEAHCPDQLDTNVIDADSRKPTECAAADSSTPPESPSDENSRDRALLQLWENRLAREAEESRKKEDALNEKERGASRAHQRSLSKEQSVPRLPTPA